MELVNRTPVVASLVLSEAPEEPRRFGLLTAKATFRMTDYGPELDTEAPEPLLKQDKQTDLGLLPRDDIPRTDGLFDVILLGAAYARNGRAAPSRRVSLSVGAERRELAVFGDRVWESRPPRRQISEPVPFVRMPLTYERAFGGSCEVLIDRDAPIDIVDATNPAGRGFDPSPQIRGCVEVLKVPPGYPKYDQTRRLPNVEDPGALIARWEDAPRPAGWATVPMDTGLHAFRSIEQPDPGKSIRITSGLYHRAHPDWVIRPPSRGSQIVLEGLTPQERLSFALPELRVLADFLIGKRAGTRELEPQCLVLLPEEKRFYLVYYLAFATDHQVGEERCMRLRLVDMQREPGAERGISKPAAERLSR